MFARRRDVLPERPCRSLRNPEEYQHAGKSNYIGLRHLNERLRCFSVQIFFMLGQDLHAHGCAVGTGSGPDAGFCLGASQTYFLIVACAIRKIVF